MEYSRRARWMGWVIGAVLMGGAGLLLLQLLWALWEMIAGGWAITDWQDVAMGLLLLLLCALIVTVLGGVMVIGYRMFRKPCGRSIRRACVVLAVVAWFLFYWLVERVSLFERDLIFPISSVVGMLLAGAVYWVGSRVLIRYAGVPEVMDDQWREQAVKSYMGFLALFVALAGFRIVDPGVPREGTPSREWWWVPVAAAVTVYFLGKTLLIAWDRRMAEKDTPVAGLAPEEARRREVAGVVPDYRPREADESEAQWPEER